ncbi:MAG: hypothetical protein OEM84_02310 [Acidimicrobiia bacterium]|nr:hypothetical protein [Acidimicrobiia bacterium]
MINGIDRIETKVKCLKENHEFRFENLEAAIGNLNLLVAALQTEYPIRHAYRLNGNGQTQRGHVSASE